MKCKQITLTWENGISSTFNMSDFGIENRFIHYTEYYSGMPHFINLDGVVSMKVNTFNFSR